MPVTTKTTTITEAEIREAVAEWLAAQNAGEGPRVDPNSIVFRGEDDQPLACDLIATVDHT